MYIHSKKQGNTVNSSFPRYAWEILHFYFFLDNYSIPHWFFFHLRLSVKTILSEGRTSVVSKDNAGEPHFIVLFCKTPQLKMMR